MKRAAFALWVLVVLTVYFRRGWGLLAAGAVEEWTLAGLWGTWLPFALLGVAAIGASGWTDDAVQRRRSILLAGGGALLVVGAAAAAGKTSLPFAAEAISRAALGLAGSAVVLFAAWGFGRAVLARVSWTSSAEPLLFELALGFGVVAALSGILALAGRYRPAAVATVLAAGATAGVVGLWRARRRRVSWPVPRGSDRWWFGIATLAVGAALVGALAPETEYDALWYHLWLPRQWLLHGAPFDTVHEYVTLYPLTFELVFGGGLVVGGITAAKLLHFCCLLLLALTAWQVTRRFFPAASPWLAAAVTVTVPTVLWEATTAYVDLALAFYVALALFALLTWRQGGATAWFWIAALCLGLGAAIKHLGLVAVMLAAAGLALDPRRSERGLTRRWLPPAAILATALLLAGPWYLRAWLTAGNPVFPELFDVFGATPAARWDAVTERGLDGFKARFGVPRSPLPLALLPWTVTMQGARFGGSLGPVFLALLPLIARAAWRERPGRWLGAFTAAYVAVWASPLSSFQLRFLVPVVMPLAVLASHGVGVALSSPTRWGAPRTAAAAIGLLLVCNLPPFIPLHEGNRDRTGWLTHVAREIPLRVVVGRQSGEEYLRERVPVYGAWQHLAVAAPPGARVLVGGSRHNLYATREPLSMEAPAARPAWSDAPSEAAAALHSLRVTHVLMERRWLRSLTAPLPALASEAFREERLALRYDDGQALVYEVRTGTGIGDRGSNSSHAE